MAGVCDAEEACDGASKACPEDAGVANGTSCDDGVAETSNDQCRLGDCVGHYPLDPFKCYRAKDLRNPKFEKVVFTNVTDDFLVSVNSELRRPTLHCNPVSVDGDGFDNAVDHLVCYTIKREKLLPRPHLEVTNQFGVIQLEIKQSTFFCMPSSKTILP